MIVVARIGLLTVIAFPDFVRSYTTSLFHAQADTSPQSVTVSPPKILECLPLSNASSHRPKRRVDSGNAALCAGTSFPVGMVDTNNTGNHASP